MTKSSPRKSDKQVSRETKRSAEVASGPTMSRLRDAAQVAALSGVSIVALAWIFPPDGLWPLTFVALAPWAFAVCHTQRAWLAHWLSLAFGWGFFLIALRWLYPVTGLGYVALAFYLAIYWVLACWALRTGRRRGISPAFVLPVVWVACEYLRAWVMTGFPWLFLSHAFHAQLPLIQICDLTGAYGVSFLAAMVNGIVVEFALWRWPSLDSRKMKQQAWAGVALAVILFGATMGYGYWRLGKSEFVKGPRVAVIQADFPHYSVPPYGAHPYEIIATYLSVGAEAAAEKPDLLVFPESVWQATQNIGFLEVEHHAVPGISADTWAYSKLCHEAVSAFARGDYATANTVIERWETGIQRIAKLRPELDLPSSLPKLPEAGGVPVTVLVGSTSVETLPEAAYPRMKRYNSALVYDADGTQRRQRYDKTHLVPFGEVVPFRYGRFHWLYRWLNSLSPFSSGGQVEYSLTPGERLTTFWLNYDGRTAEFGAPICYEDVMPYIPRAFVWEGSRRRVDFLVNISNDGWFLHSNELPQHLAICTFRAVENRVGIARAVNTGISAFIDPNGRVYSPVNDNGRVFGTGIEGYSIEHVFLDDRYSFYGQYGDWLARLCLLLSAILWLEAIVARWVLALKQKVSDWRSRWERRKWTRKENASSSGAE